MARPSVVSASEPTPALVSSHSETPSLQPRGLRIREAAAYSRLTVWAIRTLIWDRKIPYLQQGKSYVILRDDLDAYLESQRYKVRQ
jgi:excisionase family DNA binding protein